MTVNPLESSFNDTTNVFASTNDEPLLPNFDEAEGHLLYLFQDWLEFVKATQPSPST